MPDLDQLSAYDYQLPEELIAQVPLAERTAARLMVIDRDRRTISHRFIRDLPEFLRTGDLLVANNSRVLHARLFGQREKTGGKWEGLYLSSTSNGAWRTLGQTRGYLQIGESVLVSRPSNNIASESSGTQAGMTLTLLDRENDGTWVMQPSRTEPAPLVLQEFGELPLPPYIHREQITAEDELRYQTTFASHPGSVAAPTAGLHFTPELRKQCECLGAGWAEVTLHVGVGTFRPVSCERLENHVMHREWCEISGSTAERVQETRQQGSRVIAIGTTSMRTLESAAIECGAVLSGWSGETGIFIRPPHEFQIVDGLLTNFHLPKSTLLMLVAAFAGYDLTMTAYQAAINEKYRFFSYGDAMLIL